MNPHNKAQPSTRTRTPFCGSEEAKTILVKQLTPQRIGPYNKKTNCNKRMQEIFE